MEGDTRRCSNCGFDNRTTAKFCVTCGVRIPDAAPPARDPYTATAATATWPAPTRPAEAAAAQDSWAGWGAPSEPGESTLNQPAEVVAALEQALDEGDAAAMGAAAPLTRMPAFGDAAPAGDALGQAIELLDTLRGLLPIALATSAVGAGHDADAVLAQTSDDDYSALRGLVAEAEARPRDIDVMIRLSQRIDDITDLLAERDRLRAALRGR